MQEKLGILGLLKESFKEWVRDRSKALAASLAYNAILSLAPLIGFVLIISFNLLGDERTKNDVIPILKHWFTPQFVKVIRFFLIKVEEIDISTMNTITVLAAIALAWGAKEYFDQIKITVEITWNKRRDTFGLIHLLKRTYKTTKIAFAALIIILLFVFIRALLPHSQIEKNIAEIGILVYFGQLVIQFIFLFFLHLFFFIYIPPVKVIWKNAIPGATLAAVLVIIGREIMRTNMNENADADVTESFLMVLLWLYYVNLAFTFAAEFNKVYIANRQKIDVSRLTFDV